MQFEVAVPAPVVLIQAGTAALGNGRGSPADLPATPCMALKHLLRGR